MCWSCGMGCFALLACALLPCLLNCGRRGLQQCLQLVPRPPLRTLTLALAHASGYHSAHLSILRLCAGLQPGAEVYEREAASGRHKAVGKVRVVDGELGLAVLRLGKAIPAIDAGRPLYVSSSSGGSGGGEGGEGFVELTAWRPDWWPASWGREEQQAAGGGGGGEE